MPSSDKAYNLRVTAVAAGMTTGEARVWAMVAEAAGAYLRLTEEEPSHGMEREEVCHAFHSIQGWLAGRPTIRALGHVWAPPPPPPPNTPEPGAL
jgi:hypothetical protein